MNSSQQPNHDDGLVLRSATFADTDAITAMLDAATQAWVGRSTTAEEVRDRLMTPGTDVSRDCVVAFDRTGSLVGFGHLWPAQPDEIRCFCRTHPDHRGLGVGTAVQRWLVGRAEELAAQLPDQPQTLTTTTWAGDPGGDAVLLAAGYQAARFFQTMVIDFAERRPSPVADIPGLNIRTATPADDDEIFAAFVEAFAEHWGEEHPNAETWWHERRLAPTARFDPDLWLVATDGSELAGFVIAKIQDDSEGRPHGYVGDLGVRPRWRGQGLGELLLGSCLQLLLERGLPYAELQVDTENTTGAVRLYTKIGMESRPSFTIWSRSLLDPSRHSQ